MPGRHTAPADHRHAHSIEPIGPNVEEAGALRAEQPFVPAAGEEIDRRLLQIERHDAETLDRIDAQRDAALFAECPIASRSLRKPLEYSTLLSATHARLLIHRFAQIIDRNSTLAAGDFPHRHAPMSQIHPRILVRWILLTCEHDIVAVAPGKSLGHDAESFARVLEQRDVERIAVQELCERSAGLFGAFDPAADGRRAVRIHVIRMLDERLSRASRQRRHGGVIEKRPALGDREFGAQRRPIHSSCLRSVSIGEDLTPRPPSRNGKGEKETLPSPFRGGAGGGVSSNGTKELLTISACFSNPIAHRTIGTFGSSARRCASRRGFG